MNPSERIDEEIAGLADWRGKTMARLRKIIHDADSKITEEWKWGTAVFNHDGLVVALGGVQRKREDELLPRRKHS